jgi:hypothetical protein
MALQVLEIVPPQLQQLLEQEVVVLVREEPVLSEALLEGPLQQPQRLPSLG